MLESLVGHAEKLVEGLGLALDEGDFEDIADANNITAVLGGVLDAARTAQAISLTPSMDEMGDDDGETE